MFQDLGLGHLLEGLPLYIMHPLHWFNFIFDKIVKFVLVSHSYPIKAYTFHYLFLDNFMMVIS